MKTYNMQQAAEFLQTSESSLEEIMKTGGLPAAKHGQSWCFLEEDLVEYHRKQCQIQMEQMRTSGRVTTSFSQARKERDQRRATPKPDLPPLEKVSGF